MANPDHLKGIVTATSEGLKIGRSRSGLTPLQQRQPLRRRFGSEDPQRRPGDEMALMVERIVDGGVHAEEALGGSCRLEPLHLALSPSHDLVRVLGPIILPYSLLMTAGQTELSEGGAVGPQFVGHD
jgi:hypothetical protein